ncbi:sex-determining fem-1 protein [Rutstroemia sp. NJR-2017a WRK4]|nr:sex-determining fem-1 protein [Rutstroemia sp. NJR-2017a WRK4]
MSNSHTNNEIDEDLRIERCHEVFERILDQLGNIDTLSKETSPTFFVVYAHESPIGNAKVKLAKKLIEWLKRVSLKIFSDQSPDQLWLDREDGTAVDDILANQFCLLPHFHETAKNDISSVDKVILCSSEVLQRYYADKRMKEYIESIKELYFSSRNDLRTPVAVEEFKEKIRGIVKSNSGEHWFHHILTELAFLEIRYDQEKKKHGIISVQLNGDDPRYLPYFEVGSELRVILKEDEANYTSTLRLSSLQIRHKGFFKLLERLLTSHDKDSVAQLRKCYSSCVEKLNSTEDFETLVTNKLRSAVKRMNENTMRAHRAAPQLSREESAARSKTINAFLTKLHEYAWPGGDSYISSKYRVSSPEDGTCKWFTNHNKFKAWESSDSPNSTSPLLLLTAYPGSGKSVLSKHLIDTVLPRSENRIVCYFFFKDDFEHQRSAIGALCTLLHQLLDISEKRLCTSPADHALDYFERRGKESFLALFLSSGKLLLMLLCVICVLDALDECQQNDRNELIDVINNSYRTQRDKVSCLPKLFLTSRPYGEIIQDRLYRFWEQELPEIRLAGEGDDVANDIAEEIKIVVGKRIDQICKTYNLSPLVADLMTTNLGDAPGRTYLWITLVFDDLLKKTRKINKKYMENYIESFSKNPPKTVADAYEKILNRLETQDMDNQDLKKTRNILQMVVTARRPLTLEEMSIALTFAEYQPPDQVTADDIETKERIWDIIRHYCGLLVICADDKLYLLHQTVREFLVPTDHNSNNEDQKTQHTQQSPLSDWKHSIDLMSANSVFANICISYLLSNFSETNDSLLDYSASYWVDHYRQSEKIFQEEAATRTRDLCLPEHFRKWAAIYQKSSYFTPLAGPPLCLASALGLERAVEMFLLEQYSARFGFQIDLETRDEKYGSTPLLWAAGQGHNIVVKQLLERGANLETIGEDGQTPLSSAAKKGHNSIVEQLLEKGANIEAIDEFGQTPLLWAVRKGYNIVVKQLLEKDANMEIKDEDGRTVLIWAIRNGENTIVKQLLEKGANFEIKDNNGWTPLIWAREEWHNTIVKLLLEKGANDDMEDIWS